MDSIKAKYFRMGALEKFLIMRLGNSHIYEEVLSDAYFKGVHKMRDGRFDSSKYSLVRVENVLGCVFYQNFIRGCTKDEEGRYLFHLRGLGKKYHVSHEKN